MIPAVYPRPSPMSWMYLYCAFQSSEEFSALDTSSIAISFLRGSARPVPGGTRVGVEADGFGDTELALRLGDGESPGSDSSSVGSSDAAAAPGSSECVAEVCRA